MNISFHTGKSAMIAQAKALNVYGNNIANINTVGYQTLRPDFADCIYVTERRTEADWQTGHGTYIQKTDLMFSESHFQGTERMLDIAIAGEGFFAVEDRFGDVNYTRDGAFSMTQDQDTGDWYLVSGNGEYVLDYENNRIVVPFEPIGKNTVIANMDWNNVIGQIGAFTSDSVQTARIRYTYSGEITDETPARNLGAVKNLIPSTEDPVNGADIISEDGYFAVKNQYGQISYTRDETLSIQQFEGKWYIGSSNGGFILDYNNELIPADPSLINGDYYNVAWEDVQPQIGVFTFNEGELSTTDNFRYNVAAAAAPGVTAASEGEALSSVTLSDNEAMFAVEDENGIRYTHNVHFDVKLDSTVDLDGDGIEDGAWYLSTVQGEYVLDQNGQRIFISEAIDSTNVDYSALNAMVGVFEFSNPYGLEAGGTNRYVQTDRSGPAMANPNATKLQGSLVVSNVDLATQMVKLIETQRAYQISSRVVTTSDELARIANNLR